MVYVESCLLWRGGRKLGRPEGRMGVGKAPEDQFPRGGQDRGPMCPRKQRIQPWFQLLWPHLGLPVMAWPVTTSCPRQRCWPLARTACVPCPSLACLGAPCSTAHVTTLRPCPSSRTHGSLWTTACGCPFPRAEVKDSSFGADNILLLPWGCFHSWGPRGTFAGRSCCRSAEGCEGVSAARSQHKEGGSSRTRFGGVEGGGGGPTQGPSPRSVHTWLSSPSKRSIIKKRMDQNVGSGIIVTAFG